MHILLLICVWIMWLFNPTLDGFICNMDLTVMIVGFNIAFFPDEGKTWQYRLFGLLVLIVGILWAVWIYKEGLRYDGPRMPRW